MSVFTFDAVIFGSGPAKLENINAAAPFFVADIDAERDVKRAARTPPPDGCYAMPLRDRRLDARPERLRDEPERIGEVALARAIGTD